MGPVLTALTLVTALACGLSAGVFFAFSSFVMKALGRMHAPEGVAAMQSINVAAVTPAFMVVLFGPALASVALLVAGLADGGAAWSGWLIAAAVLYLGGPVGLTIGYHVPRNDALAELAPDGHGTRAVWARYLVRWTAWNHVRSAAALAAAAALTVALHVG